MLCLHDPLLQENGTLPRGPGEVGPLWRAQARLGYAVLSARFWSALLPMPGLWVTVVTRIVEKTGLWTANVMQAIIAKLYDLGHPQGLSSLCL